MDGSCALDQLVAMRPPARRQLRLPDGPLAHRHIRPLARRQIRPQDHPLARQQQSRQDARSRLTPAATCGPTWWAMMILIGRARLEVQEAAGRAQNQRVMKGTTSILRRPIHDNQVTRRSSNHPRCLCKALVISSSCTVCTALQWEI